MMFFFVLIIIMTNRLIRCSGWTFYPTVLFGKHLRLLFFGRSFFVNGFLWLLVSLVLIAFVILRLFLSVIVILAIIIILILLTSFATSPVVLLEVLLVVILPLILSATPAPRLFLSGWYLALNYRYLSRLLLFSRHFVPRRWALHSILWLILLRFIAIPSSSSSPLTAFSVLIIDFRCLLFFTRSVSDDSSLSWSVEWLLLLFFFLNSR